MAGAVHQNDIENNPKIPEMQQIAIRSVLVSELAYENEDQIKAAVTNQWGVCDDESNDIHDYGSDRLLASISLRLIQSMKE